MECPSCGSANQDGSRFCGDCGSPLPQCCRACGRENPSGNSYCGNCGAPLTGAALPERSSAVGTPAKPVSPGAERRQLTVMFWASFMSGLGIVTGRAQPCCAFRIW